MVRIHSGALNSFIIRYLQRIGFSRFGIDLLLRGQRVGVRNSRIPGGFDQASLCFPQRLPLQFQSPLHAFRPPAPKRKPLHARPLVHKWFQTSWIRGTQASHKAPAIRRSTPEVVMTVAPAHGVQEVRIQPRPPLVEFIHSHLASLYETLLIAWFVPFLVYFMFSWRDHIQPALLRLFEGPDRNVAARSLRHRLDGAGVRGRQFPPGPASGGREHGLFLGVPAAIRPLAPKPERSTEATDQIVVVFLDGHHRSDVESLKESRRLQIRCETTGVRTPVLMTTRARPPSNKPGRTDIFPAKCNRRNWILSKLRPTSASPTRQYSCRSFHYAGKIGRAHV